MDKRNQEDRIKIHTIIENYREGVNYYAGEAINDIFNLFEPPQYIPYTIEDSKLFMNKKIQRKSATFRNEICKIVGCDEDNGMIIKIPIDCNDYDEAMEFGKENKSFDTVLKEWEYLDGGKIGKKV